jgi:elongation factor Ts
LGDCTTFIDREEEGRLRMAGASQLVKELREKTGAGILDCQKALQENGDDIEKAIDYLRQKGLAAAQKKAGRETNQGLVHAYIHMGGKIGVLIEVNCETDFVARNEEFKTFVNDLALQVAAAKPSYVKREDIPKEIVDKERVIYEGQAKEMGKPPAAWPKIVEGKLEKFYQESCLMEQAFIKDPAVTVKDLLAQKIAKIGENMNIRRFTRYQLGEA